MGIIIKNTGSYLPPKILDNQYFEEILDTSDEWITKRTGIKKRHFSTESVAQMAIKSVEPMMAKADASKIKLIVCATFSDEEIIPAVSSKIANHFQIFGNVRIFDINLACTGFVAAMDLAEKFLETGEQALVVASERISSFLDMRDRTTAILFGDGAGAVLVQKTDDFSPTSYGLQRDEELLGIRDKKIYMNGNEVFKFAVNSLKNSLSEIIAQKKDYDFIVSHQANIRILNHVSKSLGISGEVFYSNIADVGNTSAASIPICLDAMKKEGFFKSRKRMIISGFGAGLIYYSKYVEMECDDEL